MGLILSALLACIGVAAFPCWKYSARWGYAPSALAGVLLVLVVAIKMSNRGAF